MTEQSALFENDAEVEMGQRWEVRPIRSCRDYRRISVRALYSLFYLCLIGCGGEAAIEAKLGCPSCPQGTECIVSGNIPSCVDVEKPNCPACPQGTECIVSGNIPSCVDVEKPNCPACPQGTECIVSGNVPSCVDVEKPNCPACPEGTECVVSGNESSCVDVDECASGKHTCSNEQVCGNKSPGFECLDTTSLCAMAPCPSGFECSEEEGARSCRDIDECAVENACPPSTDCIEREGAVEPLCQGRVECGVTDTCSQEETCVELDAAPGFRCEPKIDLPPGDPGCGLDAAAFCDPFDAPSVSSRSGELQESHWSAARIVSENQGDDQRRNAFDIKPTLTPVCHPGLPNQVVPNNDFLVCDATKNIQSNHLLVIGAANWYGQHSARIRQPFDFSEEPGIIRFDLEVGDPHALCGWPSLSLTEDPTPGPGYALKNNNEGSSIPRNGFSLQFKGACAAPTLVNLYTNYSQEHVATGIRPGARECLKTEIGKLSRFELRVSRTKIEVWATAVSNDGLSFSELQKVYEYEGLRLPFGKGYVHLNTHNHAVEKYWTITGNCSSRGVPKGAWTARWDNVGFSGPKHPLQNEYDIPNSLAEHPGREGVAIGWFVPDVSSSPLEIQIPDVAIGTAGSASLSLTVDYGDKEKQLPLRYRFNGNAWQTRVISAEEQSANRYNGSIGIMLPAPIEHLKPGQNILEITTDEPLKLDPVVANVTLHVQ